MEHCHKERLEKVNEERYNYLNNELLPEIEDRLSDVLNCRKTYPAQYRQLLREQFSAELQRLTAGCDTGSTVGANVDSLQLPLKLKSDAQAEDISLEQLTKDVEAETARLEELCKIKEMISSQQH